MAGTEAYTASVDLWPGIFVPKNWTLCEGQILSITSNPALYSLIGSAFGGDGTSTFGLPDFRGRIPIGVGQGPGTSPYSRGAKGGAEQVTLAVNNLPSHNHTATFTPGPPNLTGQVALHVKTGIGTGTSDPTGKYFGNSGSTGIYYSDYTAGKTMATATVSIYGSSGSGTVNVGDAGGSRPFDILQPYTAMYFIICVSGLYPPRS